MLAIWSLVPLPFLKPAWTSGSSWFMYCWSLSWSILSITLLAYILIFPNNIGGKLRGRKCFSLIRVSLRSNIFYLVQFSSVQSLCNPMDCSTPGLPVHYQLPELAQTHVHQVGDTIHPTHPLLVPFSSCLQSFLASGSFLMSQFFASGGQSIRVSASASVLSMNIQDWFSFRTNYLGLGGSPCSPRDAQVFSNTTVQKHQFFSTQLSL